MSFFNRLKQVSTIKKSVLIISVILIVTAAVGGTIAWLTSYASNSQSYSSSNVTCEVQEQFDGITKSNVKIKNTGDIDAYIRVAIEPSWVDSKGNVAAQEVKASDYTISLNTTDWFVGSDGYYYCSKKVSVSTSTPTLVNSCTVNTTNNYKFNLDIISSAIQANPKDAVENAWSVVKVDAIGNLTNK